MSNEFSTSGSSWMQDNMSLIGPRKLIDICITGSHDSGMSKITGHTLGGTECNTITQTHDVGGQLNLGARYFDIRPVITGGGYSTGHYTHVGDTSWQGANGETIQEIINGVNAFTSENAELVILNLSHSLNTDLGNNSYASFTQDEWNGLFKMLADETNGLKFLFSMPSDSDLTKQTLETFIGNGKSAVIVIVEGDNVDLSDYSGKGFYPYSSLNAYNKYSDTNDVNAMMSDQLKKMKEQREKGSYFLISWTLTQDAVQAVGCNSPIFPADSVLDLASTADSKLLSHLKPAITQSDYPNIIYIDDIVNRDFVTVAMYANGLI
ncbi:hypothetical protein [Aureibacter tunicatorum]|uniref:PLC-like phosphodiesterase n=1 Tax=Aureibacter tunicatorum TaxID=866807 RepID=A0AAE4BQB7_9BACT|nr:hypothetical protein [Aureibacter tunicatorum]MDR6237371.1 hypothetical protein [Aureibacter tunicatorum]BDD06362.1 hypothetical protein AUTU_38450 [Aureibacter tunicatorum]